MKKPIKPLKKALMYYIIENNIKCCYCGRKYDGVKTKRTIDHIIPESKDGTIILSNILVCCGDCNVKKGNDDLIDFIKKNKRAKENLRKYLGCIEECYVNGRSYYKALEEVVRLIKKV